MSIAKKLIDTLKADLKASKAHDSYMQLVELFPLQSITTKEQHRSALKVVEKLISFMNVSTIEKDEGIGIYLKTLSGLVSDYEQKHYRTPAIHGKDMLAYLMDLQGLQQRDLAKELGGQSIVSKILTGERELNLRQIKALSKRFKISPEIFI